MKTILVLALAVFVAGCAAAKPPAPAEEPMKVAGKADFDRLWSLSLRVVGVRFPIKSAEESAGRIESDYLVGPLSETGFKSNTVTYRDAAYDVFHTVRRRVIVTLAAGDVPVSVQVERQRMVRIHRDVLPAGTYSLDNTKKAVDTAQNARWVDDGRDAALETVIAGEIENRYRAGGS
jgi:hypothetical protein